MFTIKLETCFWASHQLALPDGSKEPLHHHNWAVVAKVSGDNLDGMGLVMDFGQLKAKVDEITSGFDNVQLDRIDYFQRNNPSAENVAKYIFDKLEPKLPNGVKLRSVRVAEEPGCSAKFSK
ncbi:MAG: 6-carboxytetrahydropterin synthase [Phycisphaerae bacterium]|nr:6-carboxytetrahydropterin synthase [Phycisphaerae bacterium]MDD5380526.1 6-carboxytetrahydropterin synthase [Phycisphaerae bacterium]